MPMMDGTGPLREGQGRGAEHCRRYGAEAGRCSGRGQGREHCHRHGPGAEDCPRRGRQRRSAAE